MGFAGVGRLLGDWAVGCGVWFAWFASGVWVVALLGAMVFGFRGLGLWCVVRVGGWVDVDWVVEWLGGSVVGLLGGSVVGLLGRAAVAWVEVDGWLGGWLGGCGVAWRGVCVWHGLAWHETAGLLGR